MGVCPQWLQAIVYEVCDYVAARYKNKSDEGKSKDSEGESKDSEGESKNSEGKNTETRMRTTRMRATKTRVTKTRTKTTRASVNKRGQEFQWLEGMVRGARERDKGESRSHLLIKVDTHTYSYSSYLLRGAQ